MYLLNTFRRFFMQTRWQPIAALLLVALVCVSCDPPNNGGSDPNRPPANLGGQAMLAWGGNTNGQIGDGTNSQRLSPVVLNRGNIRAIAAGGNISLAVTLDGNVWEWGAGNNTPTQVQGISGVKQIAVGARHRLALKEDGTVWAWGDNNHGQLGDASNTTRPTPVQVVNLTGVLTIAAGGEHSLAVKGDFSVWAWGK